MNRDDILKSLMTADLAALCAEADRVRREHVGDAVHLRGLIEFSNACGRDCLYCGLRRSNREVVRYRMGTDEIFASAAFAAGLGFKSLVLQSGESAQYETDALCALVRRIKAELGVAITLSIGEKTREEYAALKKAGADRYLLRFETSSDVLFRKLKPDSSQAERMACLHALREVGFQVGSGIMVGLPGQTVEMIADDIFLMQELDLDMIGFGPFIANPETPLKDQGNASLDLTLRTLAVIRIVMKNVHIPATTAMGTIDPEGRQKALRAGANVLMPNVTPTVYREMYQLYPNKPGLKQAPSDTFETLVKLVHSVGRTVAIDAGHSLKPAPSP
ncbi:MAG: [FeFe] hydrogenase H-cluster radical SAM maturase HydE [Candidatus Omnitrophica bacterium]|nr:[FeFe] hydrogenase H-cluster radical SAM maturase HydE [Candidatus Omnitrophota bacterium]